MRKATLLHILIISFVFIVAPITSATGGSKTLRSHYRSLSRYQISSMPNVVIREETETGFIGYSTIKHDYNLKTIGGDKVVVDNATGLMWLHGGSDNHLKWEKIQEWVMGLNMSGYAGYHDWRLPTVEEAFSLVEPSKRNGLYIDPVFSRKHRGVWTGDVLDGGVPAWSVGFHSGSISWSPAIFGIVAYVRPVRSVE